MPNILFNSVTLFTLWLVANLDPHPFHTIYFKLTSRVVLQLLPVSLEKPGVQLMKLLIRSVHWKLINDEAALLDTFSCTNDYISSLP